MCNLPRLLDVGLSYNHIEKAVFENCPRLLMLDLRNQHLRSITLTGMDKLEYINLAYNQLQELDLSGVPALRKLWLQENMIENMSFLNSFTILKELNICDNPVNFELSSDLRKEASPLMKMVLTWKWL
jgi:Leucine-rich repeat (LRR) protein